jgi:hypothetical protein
MHVAVGPGLALAELVAIQNIPALLTRSLPPQLPLSQGWGRPTNRGAPAATATALAAQGHRTNNRALEALVVPVYRSLYCQRAITSIGMNSVMSAMTYFALGSSQEQCLD